MYKDILQNIDNIAIWPVVSFIIFFLFFVSLLWWVFSTDKKVINRLKNLPFDDKQIDNVSNTNEQHL